jgi:hypothetical protein
MDASLELCRPAIAHLSENEDHLIGHVIKWIKPMSGDRLQVRRQWMLAAMN